jgi:hypothetical protein
VTVKRNLQVWKANKKAENNEGLFETLRTLFKVLFQAGRSPSVATELIEILNGTLERSIQAQSEGKLRYRTLNTFD